MKTLVVYYSRTGNTRAVAALAAKHTGGVIDEVLFDPNAKTITHTQNPADFERVILLSPIWAFELSEPMKIYVSKFGSKIPAYELIVTCSLFGLRTCVSNCKSLIGKPPEKALKFKGKAVLADGFEQAFIEAYKRRG